MLYPQNGDRIEAIDSVKSPPYVHAAMPSAQSAVLNSGSIMFMCLKRLENLVMNVTFTNLMVARPCPFSTVGLVNPLRLTAFLHRAK